MNFSKQFFLITGVLFMVGGIINLGKSSPGPYELKDKGTKNAKRPNVIFFAMDDLNDWVNPLRYDQVKTPNLDRLAESGVNFTNAHAPATFCTPSRTAIMSGLHASTTGVYKEDVFHYDHPDLYNLQMAFKDGGYATYGAGKIYHHMPGFVDLRGWDQYFTRNQEVKDMGWQMNGFTLLKATTWVAPNPGRLQMPGGYPMKHVPLPKPHPYSPFYRRTDRTLGPAFLEWGPIENSREDDIVDAIRTNWATGVVQQDHDQPFFLALGTYAPHYPNYVPQKYFDMYDRDAIELPSYKPDDLEDLPDHIRKRMERRMRIHHELDSLGVLKDAIRGYLAAVTFADAMLGQVLDALEESPHKDNTVVVVWSDHGFHHGEKGHWGKHTLWERTSHVPFIWTGPGIAENREVEETVSLIDIYPTLVELCRLPQKSQLDGISLAPVLQQPSRAQDRNVLIPHMNRGSYAVVNQTWRYIHYNNGSEELYNIQEDPHEWNNLAGNSRYQDVIRRMKKSAPGAFAPRVTPKSELKLIIEEDSFHWEKKQ